MPILVVAHAIPMVLMNKAIGPFWRARHARRRRGLFGAVYLSEAELPFVMVFGRDIADQDLRLNRDIGPVRRIAAYIDDTGVVLHAEHVDELCHSSRTEVVLKNPVKGMDFHRFASRFFPVILNLISTIT